MRCVSSKTRLVANCRRSLSLPAKRMMPRTSSNWRAARQASTWRSKHPKAQERQDPIGSYHPGSMGLELEAQSAKRKGLSSPSVARLSSWHHDGSGTKATPCGKGTDPLSQDRVPSNAPSTEQHSLNFLARIQFGLAAACLSLEREVVDGCQPHVLHSCLCTASIGLHAKKVWPKSGADLSGLGSPPPSTPTPIHHQSLEIQDGLRALLFYAKSNSSFYLSGEYKHLSSLSTFTESSCVSDSSWISVQHRVLNIDSDHS